MTWSPRLRTAAFVSALFAAACGRDPPREHAIVAEPAATIAGVAPAMEIVVTEVRGDAALDVDGARLALPLSSWTLSRP